MPQAKRLLPSLSALLAVIAAVVLLAGGGSTRTVTTAKGVTHSCTASDSFMQCALTKPKLTLGSPLGAPPTSRGVDFAWGGPSVATMRANGWTFGASYLSFDGSKNFSPALINAYHAAGIRTVLVWETGSTRAEGGYAAGRSDAFSAIQQANARGAWRVLYFAIDCDCAGAIVAPYFDGVRSVLPVREIGAYGGYFPIHYLFDTGRIGYAWQTYAWSNGLWDGRAQLQQWLNGSSVDYDRSYVADFGQVPFAPPKPACDAACVRHHRAQVAHWKRAAASSGHAYRVRGCPVLAQRISWFSRELAQHSRTRVATRKGALATSRRVYRRRSCKVFAQRVTYFTAKART